MEADVMEAFAYDHNGRVINKNVVVKAYGGTVHHTSYVYDMAGNLRQVVYEGEKKQDSFAVTYRSNCLGQVTAVADSNGPLATYAYNAAGSIREETFQPGTGKVLVRRYRYDSRGSLTELSGPYFKETLTYTQSGYNGYASHTGRILSSSCQFSGLPDAPKQAFSGEYQYRYAYDRLGRLTTAQYDWEPKWSYGVNHPIGYDANGNTREVYRQDIQEKYAYQSGTDRLTQTSMETGDYCYDAAGSVTAAPARGITAIEYDLQSQQAFLLAVNSGQDTLNFSYDGGGRRVFKQGKNGNKLYVLSPKGLPLVEKTDRSQTESVCYVYGPMGLIAVRRASQTCFLIKDHSGSTRGVSDGAGICAAYSYDPFGNFLGDVFELQGHVPHYLYTGQELDRESGLYNCKARFYDTYVGRFYSADPAGQFASPYIYAGGDPVNFIDPSGLWSWSIGGVFSTLAGAAAIAGGIALAPFTAGGSAALIAAGLASAGYGLGTMYTNQEFRLSEWGVTVAAGALFGGAQYAIYAAELGLAWGALAGGSLGAVDGFVTNGVLNTLNGKDFTEGAGIPAAIGAAMGAIAGGLGGAASARRMRGMKRARAIEKSVEKIGRLKTKYSSLQQQESLVIGDIEKTRSSSWLLASERNARIDPPKLRLKEISTRMDNIRSQIEKNLSKITKQQFADYLSYSDTPAEGKRWLFDRLSPRLEDAFVTKLQKRWAFLH